MKSCILFLSFLAVAAAGQAQSKFLSFKLGNEYELPKRNVDLAFFGNQNDGIVNLSLTKDGLSLIRFNPATLSKTMEQDVELPDATKNMNSEMLVEFANNNYFWLHSDWDKSAERESLYCDKIDVSKGKIIDANKKLFETSKVAGDYGAGRGLYALKVVNKYNFEYNIDRTRLLITYRLSPKFRNDRKNYDEIGMHVFDNNMKQIWGGEFTMPYTEAVMDNSDYTVDAVGNAYLLAKVYNSDARKEIDKATGLPDYHYEVMKFSKDSKKMTSIPLSLDENFIRVATLMENVNHELIIACTYGKKSKKDGTAGIFLAVVDANDKIAKYKKGYYEFPKSELQKFERGRIQRKIENHDDYEVPNLKVRDVVVGSDGSTLITCEEYYWEVYTTTNGMTYYTYYYGDIYASRIDANGSFEWLRKIPKRQKGTNGFETLGFKLIADGKGYHFLYLDNLKNMNMEEGEVPKYHVNGAGGQVVVSTLTKDGTLSKELLFDTREEDVMIFPRKFAQIDGNHFIGRAKLKKTIFQPLLITTL